MQHGGIYAEEITGRAYDTRILLRFGRYVRPYSRAIAVVLVTLPLVAACRLAQPWIIKKAIDSHITTGRLAGLEGIALTFLALLLGEALFAYLQVFLLQSVGQRVMSDMRAELFRHVMGLPVSWFDRTPVGSAVTRLTSDVEVLGEMFASGLITIVGDILLLVGIVSAMIWMDARLSLVTFSILPLLFCLTWLFRRRMRQSFREVRARLGRVNAFLAESIVGMSIIQVFNRQRDEERRFRELNASYRDANMPVIFWDASLYAIVEALSSIAGALIIWYGGGKILAGSLSFGVLVAFLQYIQKFFGPIRDLSAKYSVMQGAMAALERIFALLDTEKVQGSGFEVQGSGLEPATSNLELRTLNHVSGAPLIEFRDVCFSYREGERVLEEFSLCVRRGERVALVGESGGGKTTITRLLTRFYEIESGAILIDGRDIGALPVAELRRRIGIVLQDPCLFSGSIEFNIHLGDEQARQRVRQAAAGVGADRFIERLPAGYGEEVRERGNNFSLGEKQLISFARALAFDPEILVLDEATASVDSTSERMIQEGIRGLMQGRTSLIIAHRLSTIRDADRIVVVQRGRTMEEGTHRELMERRGGYYRLHQLQFSESTATHTTTAEQTP
jgi:ATP-binding cassette subfamily B protein